MDSFPRSLLMSSIPASVRCCCPLDLALYSRFLPYLATLALALFLIAATSNLLYCSCFSKSLSDPSPESPQDRHLPPRNTSTHACKRWLGICSKYYQIIITCEGGYLGGASHPPTHKKPSEDQTLASNCTPPPVIFIRGSCSGVLDAWRSGSLEGKVQSIIFVPAVFFPDAHHLEQLLFCHCKRGFVPSRLLRRRRHRGKRAPVTDVTDKPAAGVFCCRFWWFLVG